MPIGVSSQNITYQRARRIYAAAIFIQIANDFHELDRAHTNHSPKLILSRVICEPIVSDTYGHMRYLALI